MKDGFVRDIARSAAVGALFLVPVIPLVVAGSWIWPVAFYFPFITAKAFLFRILVEVAVAGWVVLCFLDKEYRPRFSLAGAAVLAFVLWMLVVDSFAVNAHKAFWSNFERMEGWVLLVHLAGLFFAASNVLRVERKWRAWFLTSLGVGVVVSLYALLQLVDPTDFPIHQGSSRIDASFGNSAYLAIYLLFNTFLALWLAMTAKAKEAKWWLIGFAVVESVLIFFTETRGTIVGWGAGLGLIALLTLLTAGKRARQWAAGGLIALAILAGGFYLARDSSFVRSNELLDRVATISFSDLQVRFRIWHMAWEGFVASPKTAVLGYGQEGFIYPFDRFYDPGLYGQEPWFDRAHDAFLDWLVAGGLPGFLLYISLFGAAFWLLWRRSELSRPERIVLSAALVGYAIHNLVIFDNLYSYVYLFAILALIDAQVARPIRVLERLPALAADARVAVLSVAAVVLALVVWFVNVPGMAVAAELIVGISPSRETTAGNPTVLANLLAHPSFAGQEVREELVKYAENIQSDQNASAALKQQAAELAVTGMQAQVAAHPLDTRGYLELAYAYAAGGDAQDARAALGKALTLTPTMENLWLTAGALAWNANDPATARQDYDKAYALDPSSSDLAAYAAAGAYADQDPAAGDKILLAAFGTTTVDNPALESAYNGTHDWPRLIRLWQLRTRAANASANTYFSLAIAYYLAHNLPQAIATVRQADTLFPDAAATGENIITQMQATPAP
ncbi:MAG: O-antigen ligase family protein [Patescibacteria group bacterium]|nr:O-antigen ligase family protein [Patescibacteria group bacterium]MDE1944199.1 O-antigen ligase family protein [Patescibacteria group bacterium]MDE1945500.1 O-antigen ligase family protein [Patescibacteria group bacterium]MDE2057890.1 O-antigen ligase family protein [Patescibacteria group bacterium]